ncbi:hypothetical protein BPT24_089 [Tenacibaculum phage pT24]|uniref:Uncharacterized protein n=1 Tax=Tenacibaculum phage pT24 TaxID=1880590 RepID=A0A1B4XWP8_9CAUD|nr:hypothetical protein HYP10_gp089 [Tenacibaculum phage pT24]BAV39214.1 hypothetical protein BPT24_089 [Tenacibaculum phage pT24]
MVKNTSKEDFFFDEIERHKAHDKPVRGIYDTMCIFSKAISTLSYICRKQGDRISQKFNKIYKQDLKKWNRIYTDYLNGRLIDEIPNSQYIISIMNIKNSIEIIDFFDISFMGDDCVMGVLINSDLIRFNKRYRGDNGKHELRLELRGLKFDYVEYDTDGFGGFRFKCGKLFHYLYFKGGRSNIFHKKDMEFSLNENKNILTIREKI